MAYTGSVPDTRARRLDWQAQAACRDEDLELFFEQRYEHMARTVCVVRCPVRAKCLMNILAVERGMGRDYRYGIFAGLDGTERWHLDHAAPGHTEDGSTLLKLDGPPPGCGSYEALLRHLARGEDVDDRCWSGQVRRVHGNRAWRRRTGCEPDPEPLTETPQAEEPPAPEPEREPAEKLPPAPEVVPGPEVPAPATRTPLPQPRPRPRGQTPHERRIYTLWTTGASDLDIARRMAVSVPSVKRVRDRLGLLPNLHARAS